MGMTQLQRSETSQEHIMHKPNCFLQIAWFWTNELSEHIVFKTNGLSEHIVFRTNELSEHIVFWTNELSEHIVFWNQ